MADMTFDTPPDRFADEAMLRLRVDTAFQGNPVYSRIRAEYTGVVSQIEAEERRIHAAYPDIRAGTATAARQQQFQWEQDQLGGRVLQRTERAGDMLNIIQGVLREQDIYVAPVQTRDPSVDTRGLELSLRIMHDYAGQAIAMQGNTVPHAPSSIMQVLSR